MRIFSKQPARTDSRIWIHSLILFIGLAIALPGPLTASEKPDILLILTDDMGWMDLRVQGNQKLHTPAIDRLAAEGVRFPNAYSASPVCSPTRGALMTGLAPARLQITQHGPDQKQFWPESRKVQPPKTSPRLPEGSVTIAERLREAGYATGFFGKWHLGSEESDWPLSHGFEINIGGCGFGGPPTYWDPYRIPALEPRKKGEYLTDRLADEFIDWLGKKEENEDRPWFVCLWTYNPHYPFEAPADLVAKYEGKEGAGLKNPIYGGQIEATDRAIGRVMKELEQQGQLEDTLVIFTSDNGGWSGATDNRPLRKGKGYIYEGGLRVPLIVRWPKVARSGIIEQAPVISMDLAATVLDAAGLVVEQDSLDGQSLRPLLAGEAWDREALYFHYPHFAFHKANRPASAIRSGPYKLIYFYDDESVELYHLEEDLSESIDLAPKQPERAAAMKAQLLQWLENVGAGLPTRIAAEKKTSEPQE